MAFPVALLLGAVVGVIITETCHWSARQLHRSGAVLPWKTCDWSLRLRQLRWSGAALPWKRNHRKAEVEKGPDEDDAAEESQQPERVSCARLSLARKFLQDHQSSTRTCLVVGIAALLRASWKRRCQGSGKGWRMAPMSDHKGKMAKRGFGTAAMRLGVLEEEEDLCSRSTSLPAFMRTDSTASNPSRPGRALGPPLPSKGKGKGDGKGKPKGKSNRTLTSRNTVCFGELPFGQRMHWVGAEYDQSVEGTVFGELRDKMDNTIDSNLMQKIFGSPAQAKAKPRNFFPRPAPGIAVLSNSRAQNLAIALRSLTMTTEQLCIAIRDLDFNNPSITGEDLELLASVMPSTEENTQLSKHTDNPDRLRDVERSILPLCSVEPSRLRAMRVVVAHGQVHNLLTQRCCALRAAACEIRDCVEFRELLGIVLQIGNYINHGQAAPVEGTARGFSIESLHVLKSFKRGGISALHFLCLTIHQTSRSFCQDLLAGLAHVKEASRERVQSLKSDVERFHGDAGCATENQRTQEGCGGLGRKTSKEIPE